MKRLIFFLIMILCPVFIRIQSNFESPRYRVIIDNDLAGDSDGLLHLAHQLMSPTTEIRAIIGSGHYPVFPPTEEDPVGAVVVKTKELLSIMGLEGKYSVYPCSNVKMTIGTPADSEGAMQL